MITIKFLGEIDKQFKYDVQIGEFHFDYFTGLGWVEKTKMGFNKRKAPSEKNIIECLYMDAECSQDSFQDFCDNLGYDFDSRKALDIYLKCQEIATKIRKLERQGLIKKPESEEV